MKISSRTALSALLLMVFIACNKNSRKAETIAKDVVMEEPNTADNKNYDERYADTTALPAQTRKGIAHSSAQANPGWDKKIIRTAGLRLEVKDYNAFNDLLHRNIKEVRGYIATEEQNETAYQIENTVSLKVPVDQFDNAITLLTAGNGKLVEKKITSDDVTTEVIDTRSRMEAKKQVRQRYLGLLGQAKNMDEILQVQHEINDIQEQIEAAAGRMEYLNHSAVFSTINITFYQILDANADNPQPSYFHKIKNAFSEGLRWMADLTVGLISLWPLWFGLGVFYWIYRRSRTPKTKSA